MLPEIIHIDQQFFLFLNGLHWQFLDLPMEIITGRKTWIPLYLFIIYLLFKRYELKSAIIVVLVIVCAVGFTDFISSGLMKPYFERLRPCHDPKIGSLVHVVAGCGGKYGFVSSHAANSFALFGSIAILFRDKSSFVKWMLLWAILVSYSRIYVGVHYPGDVLFGVFLGLFVSFVFFGLLTKSIELKTK